MTVAGASTLPILRVLLRVLVLLFTDTPYLDAWLDRTSSDGPRPAHRHSHVPRRPQRNCAHVPLARLHTTLVDERRSMAGRCECPVSPTDSGRPGRRAGPPVAPVAPGFSFPRQGSSGAVGIRSPGAGAPATRPGRWRHWHGGVSDQPGIGPGSAPLTEWRQGRPRDPSGLVATPAGPAALSRRHVGPMTGNSALTAYSTTAVTIRTSK